MPRGPDIFEWARKFDYLSSTQSNLHIDADALGVQETERQLTALIPASDPAIEESRAVRVHRRIVCLG
jgi:hypothetical protein